LRGGEVGGGALLHAEGVVRVAVGEGPDARIGAARWDVGDLEEVGEVLVGGIDLFAHGGDDLVVNGGLVSGRDRTGEFFEGPSKGAVFGLLREERVDLEEDFFEEILGRNAL